MIFGQWETFIAFCVLGVFCFCFESWILVLLVLSPTQHRGIAGWTGWQSAWEGSPQTLQTPNKPTSRKHAKSSASFCRIDSLFTCTMYLLHFIFVPRLFIKSTNCIGSCVRFEHLFWVGLLRGEMWSNLAELNKISFGCNNSFNPCPFSSTYGSWLPRSWVLQPLSPCVGASLEEHELDQWQSSTQPRSNGHHQHTIPPSTLTYLKVGEQGVGLFEQGDQLAHRLAQVVVAHPEQGILARGRWDSSKAGWLERPGGKRHLVANHLWCKIDQIKGVCCEGSVCRHCRGAIGESSRSCRAPRYISTISTSLLVFSTSLQHIRDTRRKVEIHVEQWADTSLCT